MSATHSAPPPLALAVHLLSLTPLPLPKHTHTQASSTAHLPLLCQPVEVFSINHLRPQLIIIHHTLTLNTATNRCSLAAGRASTSTTSSSRSARFGTLAPLTLPFLPSLLLFLLLLLVRLKTWCSRWTDVSTQSRKTHGGFGAQTLGLLGLALDCRYDLQPSRAEPRALLGSTLDPDLTPKPSPLRTHTHTLTQLFPVPGVVSQPLLITRPLVQVIISSILIVLPVSILAHSMTQHDTPRFTMKRAQHTTCRNRAPTCGSAFGLRGHGHAQQHLSSPGLPVGWD